MATAPSKAKLHPPAITTVTSKHYKWNPHTNWQDLWASRCESLCCHTCGDPACDTWRCGEGPCADIACDSCGLSIVRPLPPRHRFVCLDCLDSEGVSPMSVDFCDDCFKRADAAHMTADGSPHLNWLRIDGDTGDHSATVREHVRGVAAKKVVVEDLVVLPIESGQEGEDCSTCFCYEVDGSNPAACCAPGCKDPSHRICCGLGTLDFLTSRKKSFYVPGAGGELPPATYFCPKCNKEDMELKLRVATMAEVTDAVLGDFHDGWAEVAAEEAVAKAPSLAGHARVHRLDLNKFNGGGSRGKKLAVAEWAVAELKEVHAGKANAHVHAALDELLSSLG